MRWDESLRRVRLDETLAGGVRVGASILPTLVFALVLAQILRERFAVPSAVFGGLIIYAVVNTMIPGLLLKLPPPEFEEPHAHELPPDEAAAVGYEPATKPPER